MSRKVFTMLVVVLVVLSSGFLANRVYSYVICSPSEREAIASIPHYSDRQIAPQPNIEVGSCQVTYGARADRQKLSSYYRTRLEDRGWVRPAADEVETEDGRTIMFGDRRRYSPYGIRDGMIYEATVYNSDSGGSFVSVHVSGLPGEVRNEYE